MSIDKFESRCDTLKTTVIQGVHGKDKSFLDTAFSETDLCIIEGCVERLPSTYVMPLLMLLSERLSMKPNKGPLLLPWLKNILIFHSATLISSPDITAKLAPLIESLELRASSHQRMAELGGKIDLLLSQVAHKNSTQKGLMQAADIAALEPLQTYTEEALPSSSSDDDENSDAMLEDVDSDALVTDQSFADSDNGNYDDHEDDRSSLLDDVDRDDDDN